MSTISSLLSKIVGRLCPAQPDRRSQRGKIYDVIIDAGDAEESYLKASHLIRGEIISKYSHVEFMMADIYFRSIRLEQYRHLPVQLPYSVKTRINTLKKIALMEGPISKYRTEILSLADKLLDFENIRQFMAHGNMIVRFEASPLMLDCFVYDQPKNSGPILKRASFTIDHLSQQSISLGLYADDAVDLFYRMCMEIPMPPMGPNPANRASHVVTEKH